MCRRCSYACSRGRIRRIPGARNAPLCNRNDPSSGNGEIGAIGVPTPTGGTKLGDGNRTGEIAEVLVGVEQADKAVAVDDGGKRLVLFAQMTVDARRLRARFRHREIV